MRPLTHVDEIADLNNFSEGPLLGPDGGLSPGLTYEFMASASEGGDYNLHKNMRL
jgi:hypothetical protein